MAEEPLTPQRNYSHSGAASTDKVPPREARLLRARPTMNKPQNRKAKKGDTSIEVKKGTFLSSFDKVIIKA
jgi:hypothetical protein